MAIYYVFQGETFKEERAGGYVWSPQLAKNGARNAGYSMMKKVRKDDFILHHSGGKILAISVAKGDCYEDDKPSALCKAKTTVNWNTEGYRIDVEYMDLEVPLITTNYQKWLSDHYEADSAFTKKGMGNQRYMCPLAEVHARFLINEMIKLQSDNVLIGCLKEALDEINNKYIEYDQDELEMINDLVGKKAIVAPPTWQGKKEARVLTTSKNTGRVSPKRNANRAAGALARAGFKCEFNDQDRTFPRENGTPYTEAHHLIPLSCYRDFDCNLDVLENIVSLCATCHRLLHEGQFQLKRPLLKKLFDERKDALHACGMDITLEQLEGYYRNK